MKRMGKYLYAIVNESGDRTYGPIGINGGVVHTLSLRCRTFGPRGRIRTSRDIRTVT